jgi:hypothetical protein
MIEFGHELASVISALGNLLFAQEVASPERTKCSRTTSKLVKRIRLAVVIREQLNSVIQCRVSGVACLTMSGWLSDWSAPGDTHGCPEIGLPSSNRNA